ncbi:ATP-dependent DNA ligase LigA [Haloarchaeobius iranensis]|uniref:DNA ligase n=1 Tax=Haloarchaeobius iranensis TaxID=996166 RepID=A0A1G9W5S1_9EURY|nr:ATP-dependent DNA ligase LigA [Haloarchaeobius iranensis]SDM79839.1 DNA ligase-1 [Haloarchaeobius iranensis]
MKFASFAERAAAMEAEPADLETVALVSDLFAAAEDDLAVVARFVQGRVFPAWDERTLDVGPSTCYTAIARAAGPNVDADDVEARVAEVGEVGAVAEEYEFGGQTGLGAFGAGGGGDDRTVASVYEDLVALASTEGAGSESAKVDRLFGLFNESERREARYLARLVLAEMRIGVGEGTVRDAIADAFDVPVDAVERALQVSNDYGLVAETAREEGEGGVAAMDLEVGRPVQPMLAQAGTASDALAEWGTAAVETKFDGARVQVHWDGEEVSVYSRNMEDVTDALPEVGEFVREHCDAPAILDGEVVAVADDGEPLPFQQVLRRFRRKHDVAQARERVTVELRAFDCLHAGGDDLLDVPLRERYDRLRETIDAGVGDLLLTDDPDVVAAHEADALAAGHEGIMLKDPESTYSPGKRGQNWLKRKPDVETLDCVVVGAEWGEGRRANLFGTFHIAVRDGDDHLPVGKVATGITDEELAELTERLEQHVATQSGRDVTFEPAVVFEVGYEEIQTSPTYESGYALRFPRFVSVRDDKAPADADSLTRLERLAESQ